MEKDKGRTCKEVEPLTKYGEEMDDEDLEV
jgi:hypothetical protein